MPQYTATFHCGDTAHVIAIETGETDDQTLEEWLAKKLERRLATAETKAGPVLYPMAPRFAAFPTAGGGFEMIPIDRITHIEVHPADA